MAPRSELHDHTDLGALRGRLDELERRRAELAATSGPNAAPQLEVMRFELAAAAWQLDELEALAW